jgi:Lysylphosphatidylglycerol synthase TM region
MAGFKYGEHARGLALLVLLVVTAAGIYSFATGDWTTVLAYWQEHWVLLPLLLMFSIIDVALEAIAWMWLYSRRKMRAFDQRGVLVYLAGRAGLLMPVQLGRLIRPDAMVRLARGAYPDCLKAEILLFVLDGMSVLTLLAALLAYRSSAWLAVPAGLLVACVLLFLGDRIAELLAHTRLGIEKGFWWRGSTVAIVAISMTGWLAHGAALYVVVAGLPGNMTLWDALIFGPGSAVLGSSTGLPGGIGATEGILGASLSFRQVPVEHLAVAVAAFRMITFWIWIPVGWLALLALRRESRAVRAEEARGIM